MSFLTRHTKIVTITLLLVQLCLPLSGPVHIIEYLSASEAAHKGIACAHTDADSGHESPDGHKQIIHCHELDAPCDTVPGTVLELSAVVSSLTSSDKGVLLTGYKAPIDIPPKSRS